MTCHHVVITKEGLRQLIQELVDRTYIRNRFRNTRRAPTVSEVERSKALGLAKEEEKQPTYDPTKPLQFKFKVLEDYLKEYEKIRNEGKDPVEIDPKFGKRRVIEKPEP